MNANAKKWIKALRSGKYGQGEGRLKAGSAYCCLGVACELYRQEVGGEWTSANVFVAPNCSQGQTYWLPSAVKEWLGLENASGDYSGDSGLSKVTSDYSTLSELNDRGYSFQDIADVIEAEPDGLFVTDQ